MDPVEYMQAVAIWPLNNILSLVRDGDETHEVGTLRYFEASDNYGWYEGVPVNDVVALEERAPTKTLTTGEELQELIDEGWEVEK